ncbi:hypothetical protein PD280_07565 [Virgibacillus salarius]|uniref:hypothetical protein n=1 Tax=Virgibacillus salarius TaxID=447199 RepID=UPI00040E438E|nr:MULTISPECIES: hypothetical protein [Bacillaceae]WBX81547.1 hypothetical protein PD280_07565 [Virgibacillus salarius]
MFYPLELQNNTLNIPNSEVEKTTFKDLGLREAQLEEFLASNLELLVEDDENLLLVGQQVRDISSGRTDLIAVDENGNLVLIEIKRDLDDIKSRKEPFEFQAIRYAATLAKINNVETLVNKIYAPYIEKKREISQQGLTAVEQAQRNLNTFLESNESKGIFNKKQRIILVASQFDDQTLSACAWLSNNNVDISCFTIEPLKFADQLFIDFTKILPVQRNEDFYVDLAESNSSIKRDNSNRISKKRYLPRMKELFEWGILSPNQKVSIKNQDNSDATVVDEKTVSFNENIMSYNQWGKVVTGWSAMSVYEWIIPEGQTKTLHELRLERLDNRQWD